MTRMSLLLVLAALLAAGCSLLDRGPDPREQATTAATRFLEEWAAGDVAAAAARTDDPTAAETLLGEVADRLAVDEARFEPGEAEGCGDGDPCTVDFTATLTLRALGEWTYDSSAALRRTGEGDDADWLVRWAPSVVHPELVDGATLSRSRGVPSRASILDRQGRPLTEERRVVVLGVEPRRMTDPEAVYGALAGVGVDRDRFAARGAAAQPDHFVEAITLREEQFAAAGSLLAGLPGIVTRDGTRALAPTPAFARAVLGTVGPATEETLADAGPYASPADQLGASGLQRAFQERLAGRPGGRIEVVRDGETVATLHEFSPQPGAPLPTTLDLDVQTAAEQALEGVAKTTALVAIDVPSGGVLAAANAPDAGVDRALSGQYPPGSTFKIVSASALLRAGVAPDEPVPCPSTTTVGGKRFKNYEFTEVADADFRDAFAASCNTSFVQLTDRLPEQALPQEATASGLGAEWDLGLPAFSGDVPEPVDVVDEAAAMIGQSRVLASPLSMATVAATVAGGVPRPPVLLPDDAPPGPAGDALPEGQVSTLREYMRAVVTEGTGRALAPYGEVHAKTGTAEYGTEVPPRTHAWLVGYRGDVAFAVLVEDGASGSADAAPVAARFLDALDTSRTG
jgi:cell division protein FtsI/penicillin-binding protein 2